MANTRSASGNDADDSYTKKVVAGTRTYFFDIETNRAGRQYLSIIEASSDGSSAVHNRLVVFQQHLELFNKVYLKAAKRLEPKLKAFDVEKIRVDHPRAFTKWTLEDDELLIAEFKQGLEVIELAKLFQRQPGGIHRRLLVLGLIEPAAGKKPSTGN